jgi:hypothetical protein
MRINMRNAEAQLLRPSSSDAIGSEELVRPVSQSTEEMDAAQLLRSVASSNVDR